MASAPAHDGGEGTLGAERITDRRTRRALLGYQVHPAGSRLSVVPEEGPRDLELTRLSPADMSCLVVRPRSFGPGDRLRFRIGTSGEEVGPLNGLVTETRGRSDGGADIGVAFERVPVSTGRLLLALIRSHLWSVGPQVPSRPVGRLEHVSDPRRVEAILRNIFDAGTEALIRPVGGVAAEAVAARPVVYDADAELGLGWAVEPPWPVTPLEVEISAYNSVFVFRAERAVQRDGLLHLAAPQALMRIRSRKQPRVPAPGGAFVGFQHPLWPEIYVRRPVHDVSLEAISIQTHALKDALFPGLEIPYVEVSWPGLGRFGVRASVRHVSEEVSGGSELCGLALSPVSTADDNLWREASAQALYPNTRTAGGRAEEMWELFDRSGYFGLGGQGTERFERLRPAFAEATRKIADAPKVAYQLIWPSDRGAEATVTLVKPYRNTWLGFQLARRQDAQLGSDSKRRMLREVILHGYEYTGRDPGFDWFVTWVQLKGRFSRLLMYDFIDRWRHDRDRVASLRFRAMEATCHRPGLPAPPWMEVGPARPEEIASLLDVVGRTRPRPYVEAHDLVPERFDHGPVREAWARSGLLRDREVLVARDGDRALAAAICEVAEEGMHLFGLLDLVRTFALVPDGDAAFAPLLEGCRSFYHARDKRHFTYACEHRDFGHALAADFIDMGEADLTVAAADLMPDQLEHCWEVTAPRPPAPRTPAQRPGGSLSRIVNPGPAAGHRAGFAYGDSVR